MRVSEDASLDKASLQKAPHPRSRIGCETQRRGPDARFLRIQEAKATLPSLCH